METRSQALKDWAQRLKTQIYALYLVSRDPATPWYAKLLAAVVVAYALSPIDLIPDFVPVLGYLDDVLLVPFGLWLAVRLVPADVMMRARERAALAADGTLPVSRTAGVIVVLVWLALAALAVWIVLRAVL
jgi:uncharacterized membrane protein YkvA (DUF1232 family)